MKSVLPPELESKRIKIAKAHNLLVCGLLAMLFVGLILMALFVPRGPSHRPSRTGLLEGFLIIALLEGYGIYRIIDHDNHLCRRLEYMCPSCHKPLYEPRAPTWVNGLCPKCGKSVM